MAQHTDFWLAEKMFVYRWRTLQRLAERRIMPLYVEPQVLRKHAALRDALTWRVALQK